MKRTEKEHGRAEQQDFGFGVVTVLSAGIRCCCVDRKNDASTFQLLMSQLGSRASLLPFLLVDSHLKQGKIPDLQDIDVVHS